MAVTDPVEAEGQPDFSKSPGSKMPRKSGGMGGGMGVIMDCGKAGRAAGPGTVVVVEGAKSLVIAQTRDVHDKVLDLLRSLREARKICEAAASSN